MDIVLTQAEADHLIGLEKQRTDDTEYDFPHYGEMIAAHLISADRREAFILDVRRGRIDLQQVTYQNRGRAVVPLLRIDIAGPGHRNPDGEDVPCPHIHRYREGFGDKWAFPLPAEQFRTPDDVWAVLQDFYQYCNIVQPPIIRKVLFT